LPDLSNDPVDSSDDAEAEGDTEVLMPPTPADAYLAADWLLANESSDTSYDAIVDDLVDSDESFVVSVDDFFASASRGLD
jgi:hypothetical protein